MMDFMKVVLTQVMTFLRIKFAMAIFVLWSVVRFLGIVVINVWTPMMRMRCIRLLGELEFIFCGMKGWLLNFWLGFLVCLLML